MQPNEPNFDYQEILFATVSVLLITLIGIAPWWVDYYETGSFFRTERDLFANLTSTSLNLIMVLSLIYFFSQRAQRQQSRNLELQRLAITDHLTQIHNARFFHQRLEKEVERASRQREVFSLLFFDIDGFKRYNDSYGHTAGDALLKDMGRIISEMIREGVDCGARYGGDEFSVILIDTDLAAGLEVGERIRLAFHQSQKYLSSLSMGAAAFKRGDSSDRLLKRADEAMYRAKRKGGNRIESEAGWSHSHYDKTA
ncbi:MAG: GGDEF domain-containing protein [Nitrospirae bacterium]|nr:GGDEF domain-containing protein [Candidatus Manganitrophaceae bacterium]